MKPVGIVWVAAAAVLTAPAVAQTPRNCDVRLESAEEVVQRMFGARTHQFATGNVRARCVGQPTTIRTDSFAHYPELNRADFVGRVRFRDVTVALDADRANYFLRDERIEAYGNVRLVNRANGSVLTGPRLTYWRVAAGVRDTAELYAVQRPHVEYRVLGDSADPYVIIGDRVRLKGNSGAAVNGNVTVDRQDFAAKGDSVTLDLDVGVGLLVGNASVNSRDTTGYTLEGREIAFRLTGGELTWVQARDSANATSAGWQIVGDTIELHMGDEEVRAGSAWGDSTSALSESYTFLADSLAVDLLDGALSEVRGFGTARAVALADSSSTIEPDWIAGDSLAVTFSEGGDEGQREVSRIQARGNAQAFYSILDAARPDLPPGLNYSRGDVITALFVDNTLDRVDVVGEADGVYLAPLVRRP